jgi:hypothetical protein
MDILREDDAMTNGIGPGRAPRRTGTHDAIGGDARMAVEVAYRMTRLRREAEHARLTAAPVRRASARSRLGHALVALGRLVEGAGTHETESANPLRA